MTWLEAGQFHRPLAGNRMSAVDHTASVQRSRSDRLPTQPKPLSANTQAKAERLHAEGRVHELRGCRAFAVTGDSGVHVVLLREGDADLCSCPALRPCSHAAAARLAVENGGNEGARA